MVSRPAKKKRRIRSPHPGIVLIKPESNGRHPHWRARYTDPDTDRIVKVRLDPLNVTTAEARREWAIQKARDVAKRRMELDSGAPRTTGTALSVALERYFGDHPQLRDRTKTIYRTAASKLETWGRRNGAKSADDLTRAKLMSFRARLIAEPKRVAVAGGKRGERAAMGGPRSPAAINQDLRSIRTVLGYLRDLDLFPKLTHDDLRRALKRLPNNTERAEYLKPSEIQGLLEAAIRHDAETFAATRAEHGGLRAAGSTARYAAIAPFVSFVLLTGMRFGEAIDIDWSAVDLEALDHDGKKVGEVHLEGDNTKTHKARTVGLEVSPALRTMLASMRLASGGKGRVFAFSRASAEAAGKRLKAEYGAPEAFSWQMLRSTCATYLTNAPGIFGAASAYRSAKQLGHSVTVAEKHYTDVLRGISKDARTLEAAMGIGEAMGRVASSVSEKRNNLAPSEVSQKPYLKKPQVWDRVVS